MAAKEFLLPDPGEGIHEAEIVEVNVSPGDEVKDGDPLFSVETDKAVVEIPSSFDGTIEDIRVAAGDVIEVGSVLLTFTPFGDQEEAEEEPAEGEQQGRPEQASTSTESDRDGGRRPHRPPVPASPATRSLAKRLDVDLHDLEGSGPDGRIEPGDVKAAAGEAAGDERRDQETESETPDTSRSAEESVEWVALRGVRRASAAQMTRSWREIPHVTHHDMADITDLEELRRGHAPEIEEEGGRLSLTVFLMKAAAAALGEHPRFNATIDAENERVGLNRDINIGVAVDTEDGLVVPVIDDVDAKSIAALAMELPEVANRMRSGERSPEDMDGGTFTITNPGGIGGTSFNPIINHPEVAILGAARAQETPVLSDDGDLEARLLLPLVVAFDHRVNDGADAARFMNTIKGFLEDPEELMLHA